MDDSDTEAEDSCNDITIEDVDESNVAIVLVPKFKLIECEVLSVVNPSCIWFRKTEDKMKLRKVTSDLSCYNNKLDWRETHQDKLGNGKGSLQKKKTAYFMTSGKKVGGPRTKTKFQKKI